MVSLQGQLTFVFFQTIIIFANGQKLCSYSESVTTNVSSFLNHFSTNKCLQVSAFGILPNSKVVIDECSFWNKATTEQKFTFLNSTLNKTMMKTDAGADSLCLTTKNGYLFNDYCQPSNFDQNWTFKPVKGQKGWFLIEQYSSKRCLIPKNRATGSAIELKPCNAYQTEQIWKVCM